MVEAGRTVSGYCLAGRIGVELEVSELSQVTDLTPEADPTH